MNNLVYIIAAAFIVFWMVGFFVYSLGALVHLLLIVAVVILLVRVMRKEDKPVRADRNPRA